MKWETSGIPVKKTVSKKEHVPHKEDALDFADGKAVARALMGATGVSNDKLDKTIESIERLKGLVDSDPEHAPFYQGLLEEYDRYVSKFMATRVSANR
jgi:hypothetical protein